MPFIRESEMDKACQAEISELNRPVGSQDDVLGLEVAMDDAMGVSVLERGTHLPGDGEELPGRFRSPGIERFTFQ
jgi:hypothetical protein